MASSCSSSLSSLQQNSGADHDSGTYNLHRDSSLNPHLDPTGDYSSYLRNTQKAYFAPGGRHACGSLDRKNMVKKNGSNPDAEFPIVELTELTPSKFGSKRESTVDATDSPYIFEDDEITEESPGHHQARNYHRHREPAYVAPPFGRLKESSSESSGIHSAAEERRADGARCGRPDYHDGKRRLHFRPADDRSIKNTGSFNSQDFSGPRNICRGVQLSEISDVQEYTESLRCAQQRRHGARETRPTASPGPEAWAEQTVHTKKTKNPAGQSLRTRNRKSLSNVCANEGAVDALFKHNNERSDLNAFEFSRRNSSVVVGDFPQHDTHLSTYTRGNSFSTAPSVPQTLRCLYLHFCVNFTYILCIFALFTMIMVSIFIFLRFDQELPILCSSNDITEYAN